MTTIAKKLLSKLKSNKSKNNSYKLDSTEPNTMTNQSLLTSASANIEFFFPLAVSKICQEFTNNSNDNIEGIYQFPLPKEAGFISFKTILNGQEFNGHVKGRTQAENDYEEAISNGDTSIMVEKIYDGMYQINVGNLAPNDVVQFELILATLMELTPNSARYFLPTVIAHRYGDSRLDQFNTPKTNFLAEYPFKGTVKVGEDLQAQRLVSAFELTETANGEYEFDGFLNQDFVINVALSPIQQAKALYSVNGDNEYTAIATIPAKQSLSVQNANLQLLVDCSGSMSGYSIQQASEGMACLFNLFHNDDHINLFRFGSHFEQVLDGWSSFKGSSKSTLRRAITNLRADLGGTCLLEALEATLKNAKQKQQSDILLLTDGQVWDDQDKLTALIKTANKINCRVSVIGLGNSVNESFLLNLAEQTGGFSTLVNPNEMIAQKITTLLAQIKSARGQQIFSQLPHTTWNKLPSNFTNQMPSVAYFMGNELPEHELVCTQCNVDTEEEYKQTIQWHQATGMQAKALTAITAMQRIFVANDIEKATLAEQYQQISDYTNFIMVADREDKLTSMPKLKHVPQMNVEMQMSANICYSMATPIDDISVPNSYDADVQYSEEPTFLRKKESKPQHKIKFSMKRSAPSNQTGEIDNQIFLNELELHLDLNKSIPDLRTLRRLGLPQNLYNLILKLKKIAEEDEILSLIGYLLITFDNANKNVLSIESANYLAKGIKFDFVPDNYKILIDKEVNQ